MTIELLNIDCMEYMAGLPDKAFDLAIVDPPYGVGNFTLSDTHKYDEYEWNNAPPNSHYFDELKRISQQRIIWGANYFNCFENGNSAIVWNKGVPHPSLSVCEIASVSWGKRVNYIDLPWHGVGMHRARAGIHPCEKPVKLYEWLLTNYAKPGQRILDTHLGSGSSAIAAHYFGCDFVGCELDKDYYDSACKRFKAQTAQVSLLDAYDQTERHDFEQASFL